MSTAVVTIIAAVVAAVTSFVCALLTIRGQRHTAREVANRAADERAQALIDRYQEPLLRAAYDLQSRLFNILAQGLLSASHIKPEYIERSTIWLLGQYFGWVEILRREAQFLKLPEMQDRAQVQALFDDIARACSSDSKGGPRLQIQRSEQRALGEVMVIRGRGVDGGERSDCLGYAAFCKEFENETSDIRRWFAPLGPQVWGHPGDTDDRLIYLQHALIALIALIDTLDPDKIRFPVHRERVLARH